MTARPDRSSGWSLWRGSLLVWAALMALLVATLVLAYVPLGGRNGAVGIAIAVLKALLVALVFMKLSKGPAISRLAALAGLLWLSTLFALTFTDYPFRPDGEKIRAPISERTRDAARDLPD